VRKTPKLVTKHTIFLFRADALTGVTPHFLTDNRVYAIRCCYNISMVRRAILTMSDDALSRMVDRRDPFAQEDLAFVRQVCVEDFEQQLPI